MMNEFVHLLSILGIFAVLWWILWLSNDRFKRTNYYQNEFRQLEKFTNGVPDQLEIVNTGSSHGKYALDYDAAKVRAFNFALFPQSLSYDFRILREYEGHLSKDCYVLLVIGELAFSFLDYSDDRSNTKYYFFLQPSSIRGYRKIKYFLRVKYPILSSWKNWIRIFRDTPYQSYWARTAQDASLPEAQRAAKERADGWRRQFALADMENPRSAEHLHPVFQQTQALVRAMISFCQTRGWRPVIVIPPLSDVMKKEFSREFMRAVLYDNVREANTAGIPILDYLYDERFDDYHLYGNADFLNKDGRRLFTQTVLHDLEKMAESSDHE